MKTNIEEIWKDIAGYEGHYQVSNLGNVKTLRSNRLLSQVEIQGYLFIDLCLSGKCKKMFVHRLVANHFILNPDNKPQVNHKKGIKTDNRACALEWATDKENKQHAIKFGLRAVKQPKKLNRDQQAEIITRFHTDDSFNFTRIGREYEVSRLVIRRVIRNSLE